MKMKSYTIALSTTLALGGCASTVDYSDFVIKLDKAINDYATSIQAIDADITARQNTELKKNVAAGKLLLDTAGNECAAGKEKCSLIVQKADTGKLILVSAYPIQSSMPKGLKALELVKTYVGNLKSIVEADTAAKVTASANATLGSLEEISNQLAKENGNDTGKTNKITEYKEPIVGLIGWITDKYVDHVKTEALAKATRDAHKSIKDLTKFYAIAAQSQKLAEFAGFHSAFVKSQENYDANPITESSVGMYVSAAADYEVALKAQAANPLKAFESAHEELRKQLNGEDNKKTTLVDVASAIERLEQEAKKIKDLVDAFKKKSDSANNGGQS
ncbi:MAG: hypothetical protein GKR94_07735 [Gammaproteobacteria bacterium]|nr:hypothetical protein [Gammaproteobacteria bacterium]